MTKKYHDFPIFDKNPTLKHSHLRERTLNIKTMVFLNSTGSRLPIVTINFMIAILKVRYFLHFLIPKKNSEKIIGNVKKNNTFF